MSVVNSDSVRAGASGAVAADYIIENSIRINFADSAYMSRTWSASPTDADVWTFSTWIKRTNLSTRFGIYGTDAPSSKVGTCTFEVNDTIRLYSDNASAALNSTTARVFRDPSAWFHYMAAVETDNGVVTNRCRQYINGVELTGSALTTDNAAGGTDYSFNRASNAHYFGRTISWPAHYGDMYLAETIWIDGQQLTPSSFGETDDNGNWVPIDPTDLTFGDDGCWLNYAVAPGTGDGAGTDVSGNGNHFSDSNLSANDQVNDSPTDDADNDIGNYCVWNPLHFDTTYTGPLANGNLHMTNTNDSAVFGTVQPVGKQYIELKLTGSSSFAGSRCSLGIVSADDPLNLSTQVFGEATFSGMSLPDNWSFSDGTQGTNYTDYSINQYCCMALDMDAGKGWSRIDGGSWLAGGDPADGTDPTFTFTVADGNPYLIVSSCYNTSDTTEMNFGQLTYSQTAPAGFGPVHTANLPAPAIKDPSKYFQVDTFTGTGAELAITLTDGGGGAVKPDLVWIKDRDTAVEHVLTDSARGATKEWNADSNNVESTVAEGLKSFDTSGFTLGTDVNYNASSSLNIAWCWNTQGGAGSSNEDGSINTTTTSVGQTQGFSISTWTGTGSAATVGHGLGVPMEFMIHKKLSGATTPLVYHHKNTAAPETDYLVLSASDATSDYADAWNDTAPTSTVFSVGSDSGFNGSGATYVSYCWASVSGYSLFNSYTGNGSADGTFVWCGFRPAYVLMKNPTAGENWYLWDAGRDTANIGSAEVLYANTTAARDAASARYSDFLSNGFKLRGTDASINSSGVVYIFCAFAEFPFGGEDVAQARAR